MGSSGVLTKANEPYLGFVMMLYGFTLYVRLRYAKIVLLRSDGGVH